MPVVYTESGSVYVNEGKEYDLNLVFRVAHSKREQLVDIKDVLWCLQGGTFLEERIASVDVSFPVILTFYGGNYLVVDGAHRVKKLERQGVSKIKCKIISSPEFERCLFRMAPLKKIKPKAEI